MRTIKWRAVRNGNVRQLCYMSHADDEKGQPMMEMALPAASNGKERGVKLQRHHYAGPSGISYYDEALVYPDMRNGHVARGKLNYVCDRLLQEPDGRRLKAIFAYLRHLRPVKHRLDIRGSDVSPLDGQRMVRRQESRRGIRKCE